MRTKEQAKEYNKKYYALNGDRLREKAKHDMAHWRKTDPEGYKAWEKAWLKKNPDYRWAHSIGRKFNITKDEYFTILEQQGGVCAICKRPPSDFKRRLAVDHCHSTHLIRGLLCWHCNDMLPAKKNLDALLVRALSYVLSPPAVRALGERYVGKKRIPK